MLLLNAGEEYSQDAKSQVFTIMSRGSSGRRCTSRTRSRGRASGGVDASVPQQYRSVNSVSATSSDVTKVSY